MHLIPKLRRESDPGQTEGGEIWFFGAQGPRLVLTWRLRSPDSTQRKGKLRSRPAVRHGETEDNNEVVLIDRITLAEFSYFGAADKDTQPRWRDRWQDASKLPLLVRVHVTFSPNDRRKWPELVIAPAITGAIGAASASQGAHALVCAF